MVLGNTDTAQAIRKHVDDEDRGVNEMFTPGGKQKIITINESGLYSLVLSSKLPIVYQNELRLLRQRNVCGMGGKGMQKFADLEKYNHS